jgi:hypothetical protein
MVARRRGQGALKALEGLAAVLRRLAISSRQRGRCGRWWPIVGLRSVRRVPQRLLGSMPLSWPLLTESHHLDLRKAQNSGIIV